MDDKIISMKDAGSRVGSRDQRCKRPKSISALLVGFDLEDRRVVAAFGWIEIQAVEIPTGVRVEARPTLLLFPISYS